MTTLVEKCLVRAQLTRSTVEPFRTRGGPIAVSYSCDEAVVNHGGYNSLEFAMLGWQMFGPSIDMYDWESYFHLWFTHGPWVEVHRKRLVVQGFSVIDAGTAGYYWSLAFTQKHLDTKVPLKRLSNVLDFGAGS